MESKMCKALIVEDEPEIREMIVSIVSSICPCVTSCSNALEALEELNKSQYDILLTDLNMPVMSGDLLIQKIRETDQYLKIIVITGGFLSENSKEFKNLKSMINTYIEKPFAANELHEAFVKLANLVKMEKEEKKEKRGAFAI